MSDYVFERLSALQKEPLKYCPISSSAAKCF